MIVVGKQYKNGQDELVEVVRKHHENLFTVKRLEFKDAVTQETYNVNKHGLVSNYHTTLFDLVVPFDPETMEWPRFTIGADPEMILFYGVDYVSANGLMPQGNSYSFGDFGLDGCSYTAEWRPKEGYLPIEVVKNLQSCFIQACKNNKAMLDTKWCAGAVKGGQPIGGHIHFGMDRDSEITRGLDHFLAGFYALIEKEDEAVERKTVKSYGRLSDVRDQRWGMEYRTLSSWIYSPSVSLAVLSLAKHIVNQYKIHGKPIFRNQVVRDWLNESIETQFYKHDTKFFREKFNQMWPIMMEQWPVEPALKDGLEIFEKMVKTGYKIKDVDMKKNWGISARV